MMRITLVKIYLMMIVCLLLDACGGSGDNAGDGSPRVPFDDNQVDSFLGFANVVANSLSTEALDCGIVPLQNVGTEIDQMARACFSEALTRQQESYVVFQLQGIDSDVAIAFSLNQSNELTRFRFDSFFSQVNEDTVSAQPCDNPVFLNLRSAQFVRCEDDFTPVSVEAFVDSVVTSRVGENAINCGVDINTSEVLLSPNEIETCLQNVILNRQEGFAIFQHGDPNDEFATGFLVNEDGLVFALVFDGFDRIELLRNSNNPFTLTAAVPCLNPIVALPESQVRPGIGFVVCESEGSETFELNIGKSTIDTDLLTPNEITNLVRTVGVDEDINCGVVDLTGLLQDLFEPNLFLSDFTDINIAIDSSMRCIENAFNTNQPFNAVFLTNDFVPAVGLGDQLADVFLPPPRFARNTLGLVYRGNDDLTLYQGLSYSKLNDNRYFNIIIERCNNPSLIPDFVGGISGGLFSCDSRTRLSLDNPPS